MKIDKSERGASLTEYSLLVALIALSTMVAMKNMGNKTCEKFMSAANQVQQPTGPSSIDPCGTGLTTTQPGGGGVNPIP